MANSADRRIGPEDVERLISQGNMPLAHMYCQMALASAPEDPVALYFMGWIAESLDLPDRATDFYSRSCHTAPIWNLPDGRLQHIARTREHARRGEPAAAENYLLIKAWGFGFWSDVYHVLGQLLLADLTDRIPVVHWGPESRFFGPTTDNAFDSYFESVSDYSITDLENATFDYFPPKWTHATLHADQVNKWQGEYSRMSGIYLLNRPERVLVGDFYTSALELKPWIPRGHAYEQLSTDALYRMLARRYLRPKPSILREVDEYYSKELAASPFLAVHVRGTDKVIEVDDLATINDSYFEAIDKVSAKHPRWPIFLLTDDEDVLESFEQRYGSRLKFTSCRRARGTTGLHCQELGDRSTLGIEVMVDTYLAAKSSMFIGNGTSNVSTMVFHLKKWRDEDVVLLGRNMHHLYNIDLHDRSKFH